MAPDLHQPVIVGTGQSLDRTADPAEALEPAALIAEAARRAAADAGLRGVPALDGLYVVRFLSWDYRDPARFIARELGVEPRHAAVTPVGGNAPQALVNRVARDIQAGKLDVALLVGGESFRTYMRARRTGVHLPWPKAPDEDRLEVLGDEFQMTLDAERERDIQAPVQIYPMFETALRARSGRTPEEHAAHLGQLWSDLSAVAHDNPYAWSRERLSPAAVTTPGPDNRMIGVPYPKRLNSNNDVNMAAALLMCSAAAAERLGVPRDRQVFVAAGVDCREHPFVSHRDEFTCTPAIEIGGRAVLELADTGIDDVELIDLYSCFPSAVQLGASSLGVTIAGPDRRQWSRTGGMAFAGGPWNSYSMHAIATMVGELRARDDARGLVWANGGYVTKHSFGVYSNRPPAEGFRSTSPQAAIDALPARTLASPAEAAGRATIEAYTVMFDRDHQPARAIAACRLADGRRAWGTSTDAAITAAMCDGEWVDVGVDLDDEGTVRL